MKSVFTFQPCCIGNAGNVYFAVKTANGNVVIMDHHTKPEKTVHCYSPGGDLINGGLKESDLYNLQRFGLKITQVRAENIAAAAMKLL